MEKYFNKTAIMAAVGVALGLAIYSLFLKKYADQIVK